MTEQTEMPKAEDPSKVHEARHPDGRKTFLEKWSTTILCISLFFAPLIIMGSVKSLKVQANDVRQWLPSGFEEAVVYDEFVSRFGIDEMLVLSWEDCKLGNPKIQEFQTALEDAEANGKKLFNRVISGPTVLQQIRDVGVSRKTAESRVRGLLIGPDNKTTCIVAYPSPTDDKIPAKIENRREILEHIYSLASDLGIESDQLHIGGPTVDGAAIEIESKKSLGTFLWMTMILVFLLTWYRMRDLPLTILVIFFASLCAAVSLSILYWTGGKMNLTMVMLPTLTFVLGVSGCVHVVNYYRKASTLGFGIRSADQAIIDGGQPIALSATTTAIGLMSLATSSVIPIKLFGLYSALGIVSSIAILVLVLPATLYLLRGRISKRFSDETTMSRRERHTGVSRSTSKLLMLVCRSHWWVVIPSLIGITILAVGIFRLGASVKIQNRFASGTKIITDYRWLEDHLGPLVPMEVVLRFDPESELVPWQQMQMVKSLERAIKQTTEVNATLSAATFEPTLPRGNRFADKFKRQTGIKKWTAMLNGSPDRDSTFEDAKLVKLAGDESFWRISLRVAALNDIDYGRFLEDIRANVDHQLEDLDQHGVSAELTGGIPMVYIAQHQILSDLMWSFLTAFLIIMAILMFVLRSIRAGLMAMIPNVFPPLVVFGAMGWRGDSIEIGSVMTASVALGIAVDDTLHFLTWYRRGTLEGLSRYAAIKFAFNHCAKAMIDTSLICGLGVIPFLFGVFMPTVKFALLLAIMLLTALLGDLILLPAILAGPAGNLFRLGKRKKSLDETEQDDDLEEEEVESDLLGPPHSKPIKLVRRM
ncbi:MAG: MMPL family transporter [Mariniblastus sp.]|nr:MMPL family transporter [Mariniblastus sp.]